MKSKLPILISIVAVLVPLILIPILYRPKAADVIKEPENISKLEITDPVGNVYEITDENDIAFYADLAKGTQVNAVPNAVFSFKSFIFKFYRGQSAAEYRFYMSAERPDEVYFLDGSDSAYKADPIACRKFMSTQYAVTLYDTAAPVFCVGSDRVEITPSEISWNYSTLDGHYTPIETATSKTVKKIDDISRQTLNTWFSREPDSAIITYDEGGTSVTRLLSDFPGLETDEAKYFRIKLEVQWNESESLRSYGSATYYFDAYVRANASYTLSSLAVDQGGVIGIAAENAKASDITVTCDPPLGTMPRFYDNNGKAVAFIPTSYETEPGEYNLKFSCDGSTAEFTVTVSPTQFNTKNYGNSASEIARYFSDENKKQTEDSFKNIFALTSASGNLCNTEDLGFPTKRKDYKTGYGLTMTLKATGETFRHNGIDYHVSSGSEVRASLSGQVTYVGQTVINGGIIVIDHGNGVRTWYTRVDPSRVTVGQAVTQGDLIAYSNDSGFGDAERVHFSVTVEDSFVSPLWMLEHGIPYVTTDAE